MLEPLTVFEAIQQFLLDRESQNRSKKTIKSYTSKLKYFHAWMHYPPGFCHEDFLILYIIILSNRQSDKLRREGIPMGSTPLEVHTIRRPCTAPDIQKKVSIKYHLLPKKIRDVTKTHGEPFNFSCDNSQYCSHKDDCNLHPACPFNKSGGGTNYVGLKINN